MSEELVFRFEVDGDDFTSAGQASVQVKKNLRSLGIDAETIRRVSIAMYEGEINMVIHAGGGTAEVRVTEDYIEIILDDKGPGIKDVEWALRDGTSTANDWIRSMGFGAGMGLANSKRVADVFDIKSTVPTGTTVLCEFNLPPAAAT